MHLFTTRTHTSAYPAYILYIYIFSFIVLETCMRYCLCLFLCMTVRQFYGSRRIDLGLGLYKRTTSEDCLGLGSCSEWRKDWWGRLVVWPCGVDGGQDYVRERAGSRKPREWWIDTLKEFKKKKRVWISGKQGEWCRIEVHFFLRFFYSWSCFNGMHADSTVVVCNLVCFSNSRENKNELK